MTQLITESELAHLNVPELYRLQARILDDLARSGLSLEESPLVAITLQNIKNAICRRKAKGLAP